MNKVAVYKVEADLENEISKLEEKLDELTAGESDHEYAEYYTEFYSLTLDLANDALEEMKAYRYGAALADLTEAAEHAMDYGMSIPAMVLLLADFKAALK